MIFKSMGRAHDETNFEDLTGHEQVCIGMTQRLMRGVSLRFFRREMMSCLTPGAGGQRFRDSHPLLTLFGARGRKVIEHSCSVEYQVLIGGLVRISPPIGLTLLHQRSPVIGRVAPFEHVLKYHVRIALASRRSQGVLIVDPCKDDDPGPGIEPKKQPEPPDLCAPPVPKRHPHRVALPVLLSVRVAGHRIKDQFRQRSKQPDVGVGLKPCRVLLLCPLGCGMQLFQLPR